MAKRRTKTPTPPAPPQPLLTVRATRTIVGNDGECAVVVPKGTRGLVGAAGVTRAPYDAARRGSSDAAYADAGRYAVEVYWEVVILNRDADGGPTTFAGWQDEAVPADAIEFVEIVDLDEEST